MSIVLNEREWVEFMLAEKKLGKFPAETIGRVARYYYHVKGFEKRILLCRKLEEFVLMCEPTAVAARWEGTIERAAKAAPSKPLLELPGVDVTEDEIRVVQSLKGAQTQRLAVTLLCVAKYWNMVRETNCNWVNTKDAEIAVMSNLTCSLAKRSEMLRELRDAGLIKFSKKVDNLNIQVQFVMQDSPVAMHVTDFRNVGYQYSHAVGSGEFIQCAQCGLTVHKKSNAQKYCRECASGIYVRKQVAKTMIEENTR